MKVLVTGGLGFIGSHVTDLLIEAGHEVDIIDDLSTGSRDNLNPKANLFIKSINSDEFWEGADYEVVYHLAALPRIQPSIINPVPYHEANVNGTLKVLEYCRRYGSKLIFSSSSSVYAGTEIPATEDAPIKPRNPYTLQKSIGEQYVDLYRDLYDLNAVSLRYFNVYGERQPLTGAYCTVIGIFLNQRKEGKPLTITSDGEQRRDFTYVGDVARANLIALVWSGTYNIGKGANLSINQVAKLVGGPTEYISERKGEVRETLADNSKARAEGWEPTKGLAEWLDENS